MKKILVTARKQTRALCLVLTAVLVLAASPAAVSGAGQDAVLFDLCSLGIVDQPREGAEDQITRGEFSTMVVRLMRMEGAASVQLAEEAFSDVPDSHPHQGAIDLLYALNLVNGAQDGGSVAFEPDVPITLLQASKILVNALGYYSQAQEAGGYPGGYQTTANRLHLYNGVNASAEICTAADVYSLLYNALDTDRMIKVFQADETVRMVQPGNTFRSMFSTDDTRSLTKQRGIVTATVDVYLAASNDTMTENQIEIDGRLYDLADGTGTQFIGQEVDYYLLTDEKSGRAQITNMLPTDRNRVIDIAAEDLASAENGQVKYYDGASKKRQLSFRISDAAVFVRNNIPQYGWTAENLMELQNGFIRFIDSNQDGRAEVVLVDAYVSVVVDRVLDNATVYFKEGFTVDGRRDLELNPEDGDVFVYLRRGDGTEMKPEEVKPGDVLTITMSSDHKKIMVRRSDEKVTGIIELVRGDEVLIDGTAYRIENGMDMTQFQAGRETEISLSVYGRIVYAESAALEDYLYVIKTSEEGLLDTAVLIRALLPSVLQERKQEVVNEDGGENTNITLLSCRNDALREFRLAGKVRVEKAGQNGAETVTYDAEELAPLMNGQVYRYRLNAQGEISRLIVPEIIGARGERYYNSYERTFGKTSFAAFGVDTRTQTVCIPKDSAAPTDRDYLVRVEMNNGQLYDVAAYDYDEENNTAGLIMIHIPMVSGIPGKVNETSEVGLVREALRVLNDNGDLTRAFRILSDGKEVEVETAVDLSAAGDGTTAFESIESGDLLAYSLDPDGRMDAFQILGRMTDPGDPDLVGELGEYETFYGHLLDVSYNQVSRELNRWIHTLSVGKTQDGGEVKAYEVTRSNGPQVFIYNKNRNTAEFGTIEQLRPDFDEIFISANYSTVRAIVAIR